MAPRSDEGTSRAIAALDRPVVHRIVQVLGPAAAILVAQAILFPIPAGVYFLGLILGLLGALVAVGMALIYRANRILNFAQSDLGAVPTVLAVDLIVYSGLNYFLAATIGLVAAFALGALVELAIIRRFFKASRLILTVATIGLSELLTIGALLVPRIWHHAPATQTISIPGSISFTIFPIVFRGDHLVALIVAPVALAAVAIFLRYTAVGMAVRASAERGDRASLLGIPVRRLQTLVWAIAGALSFIGVFLRAGIIGLPLLATFSFTALLAALAALMLGRLDDLPAIAVSAVALGILEQAVVWNNNRNPELVYPVFAVVIIVALLLRRRGSARTEHDGASSWQTADEVRPIPRELRSVFEVRAVTWGCLALVAGLLIAIPLWLGPGDTLKASSVVVFAIIALSIVVLTGWAGQVSLGQMSFAGFGAAVGAVATATWGLDLSLALLLSGIVGAVVALLVGLPALRLRGLFLAVTTLAFALAASTYLLSPKHFSWIPQKRIERPDLFGVISLDSQRNMYWVCLAGLALTFLAVRGIRRSRVGRVLLSQRENERAAQAFGVNVTRSKLLAFALSGFLAAFAGCLFVHVQQQFSELLFGASDSFAVFTAAVVGGLGSMTGAVLGALFLQGGRWFLPSEWWLLPSALGVLFVLMVLPGGLGGLVFQLRDGWLRWVARRHAIVVPSLVADVREDATPIERAEESVEQVDEGEEGPGGAAEPDNSDAPASAPDQEGEPGLANEPILSPGATP